MTTIDPRFVCRREGCEPSLQITAGAQFIASYVALCRRCGKAVEVKCER